MKEYTCLLCGLEGMYEVVYCHIFSIHTRERPPNLCSCSYAAISEAKLQKHLTKRDTCRRVGTGKTSVPLEKVIQKAPRAKDASTMTDTTQDNLEERYNALLNLPLVPALGVHTHQAISFFDYLERKAKEEGEAMDLFPPPVKVQAEPLPPAIHFWKRAAEDSITEYNKRHCV